MEIKQWLRKHSVIKVTELERLCDIPPGTIRLTTDRVVPYRYVPIIKRALSEILNSLDEIDDEPRVDEDPVDTGQESLGDRIKRKRSLWDQMNDVKE